MEGRWDHILRWMFEIAFLKMKIGWPDFWIQEKFLQYLTLHLRDVLLPWIDFVIANILGYSKNEFGIIHRYLLSTWAEKILINKYEQTLFDWFTHHRIKCLTPNKIISLLLSPLRICWSFGIISLRVTKICNLEKYVDKC